MKSYIVGLSMVLGLLLGATGAEGQMKFGYINSQQIMAEAPGTAAAQSEFETAMTGFRQELEQLEQEIGTLQENYQRQQATLTVAQRETQEQAIQQKVVQYQQRRQELEQVAQRRQAELVQPIMEQISEVIEEIRTEGNYSMIFDAAAGSLITADPALDLTQQVLDRLGS